MGLEQIKEEAQREYLRKGKEAKGNWLTIIGKQSEWLVLISWALLFVAIVPPFLALLSLLDKPIAYLLPNGNIIMSETPIVLAINGQVLQQASDYASRAEISHNLEVAGIASIILIVLAFITILINLAIITHKKNKFIEQYIYEHGKKES